jgi:small subunit ribosomal protein S6
MRNYEVTFIVDPVLSGEEIKTTAQTYSEMLKTAKANIVFIDEMGLRTLAYPINKRNSGVYYCIEFQMENGEIIDDLELALRRDERIMRFLTYKLDKFGIKYNEDKRAGLIGKAKRPKSKDKKEGRDRNDRDRRSNDRGPKKPTPSAEAPKPAPKEEGAKPAAKAETPKPAPKAKAPKAEAPKAAAPAAKQEEE